MEKNVKCCATCEFCVTPEEEEDIRREIGEDVWFGDVERVEAGDCELGMEGVRENYLCPAYMIRENLQEEEDVKRFVLDKRL